LEILCRQHTKVNQTKLRIEKKYEVQFQTLDRERFKSVNHFSLKEENRVWCFHRKLCQRWFAVEQSKQKR